MPLAPKWIWQHNHHNEQDQYVFFRKEILLPKQPKRLFIKVSASDSYKLYINGEWVGQGPSPCNPHYQYYDEYEIELFDRHFVIAAECYFIGQSTYMVTEQTKGVGGFWLQAVTDNGETIVTDESWEITCDTGYLKNTIGLGSSRISNWGGYKEVFLSQHYPAGYQLPGYRGAVRKAVVVDCAEQTFLNMLQREIRPLLYGFSRPLCVLQIENYLGSVKNPENLLSSDDDTFAEIDASLPQSFPSIVIDFGKETVGYPQILVEGSAGGSMSLWYGESLDMMRTDTLIFNGEKQLYSPFHRRAFRFIKLVFNNSPLPIKLYRVGVKTVRYHYLREGCFESSDSRLNKIYDTSTYTVKLATQNHFEDSVWREEMQWLADARVMSLVNYWTFGDAEISKKAIRQFFRNQMPDGKVPASGPQPFRSYNIDFDIHLILMVYEYYFYTKDISLLEEIQAPMRLLMKKLESLRKDGLISVDTDPEFGVFLDWANLDKRDRSTALNCLYYKGLLQYANMLALLGKSNDHELELAGQIKKAVRTKMYHPQRLLYMDCLTDSGLSLQTSEQTNLIAVYSGITEPGEEKELIERIFQTPDRERIKGAFLLSFLADTLFEHGFKEKAVELVSDYWGEMLDRGATTWWETFDRNTPSSCIPYVFSTNNATPYHEYIPCSHCHGWGAGPAVFMQKNILGIKPIKPGFEEFVFEPFTKGISHASGTIHTPLGTISASWHLDKDGKVVKVVSADKKFHLVEPQK